MVDKFKVPFTKLRVNEITYTWLWVNDKDWKADADLDNGASGLTFASQLEVFIRINDMHPFNYKEVVVHELMHVIFATNGMTYNVKYVKHKDIEEVLVACLAPSFLAVLRNNPKLTTWLMA